MYFQRHKKYFDYMKLDIMSENITKWFKRGLERVRLFFFSAGEKKILVNEFYILKQTYSY